MAYTKTTWKNYPASSDTPITATRLNNMENGIAANDTAITTLNGPATEEGSIAYKLLHNIPISEEDGNNITLEEDGLYCAGGGVSGDYMEKGVDYVTAGKKADTALGTRATAEGLNTTSSGNYAHAEGSGSNATGTGSHSEGGGGTASGNYAHNEGFGTTASGNNSHAEGQSCNSQGVASHAEGYYNIALSNYQHVQGKYAISDSSDTYAHIVGGGTSISNRKNIYTLDWSGNAVFAGNITDGNNNTLSGLGAALNAIGQSKLDTSTFNSFTSGYNTQLNDIYSKLQISGKSDNALSRLTGQSTSSENGLYVRSSGGGGSTVTITPTLSSGTKIADYSIDGVAGAIYAPTGGSSGGVTMTEIIDFNTAPSNPSYDPDFDTDVYEYDEENEIEDIPDLSQFNYLMLLYITYEPGASNIGISGIQSEMMVPFNFTGVSSNDRKYLRTRISEPYGTNTAVYRQFTCYYETKTDGTDSYKYAKFGIGSCYDIADGSSGSTYNTLLVPYKLYGIK